MSKNLIFPKTEEGGDNPAVLAARRTLVDKKKNPAEEQPKPSKQRGYRGRKPRCYLCGEEFEKAEMKSGWSNVLSRQGNFCEACYPDRNNPVAFQESGRIIPDKKTSDIKAAELNIIDLSGDSKTITSPEPSESLMIPEPGKVVQFPQSVKECFNCDSTLFHVVKGSKVKCAGCGTEYPVGGTK